MEISLRHENMLISQLHPITSDIVSTGGRKGKVITQLKLSHFDIFSVNLLSARAILGMKCSFFSCYCQLLLSRIIYFFLDGLSLIEAKWAIDKYLVNLLHFKMLNFTTRITPVHHPCQIVIKAIGVFRPAIVPIVLY